MTLKAKVRSAVLSALPNEWGNRLLEAKQAAWWRMAGWHWYSKSFKKDEPKEWLKSAFSTLRTDVGSTPLAILDFGCNAGNNLYTLRQDLLIDCAAYCGIDINAKVIAFAKERFPSDSFFVGDHNWFIQHANALGSFNLFIASNVLYYIDEKHIRLILETARRMADHVLVVDRMQQFFATSGARSGHFVHPYQSICKDVGLSIIEMRDTLSAGSPFGYFLASTGR